MGAGVVVISKNEGTLMTALIKNLGLSGAKAGNSMSKTSGSLV